MSRKLLIDASHPEETRVAAISGNLVEEFDCESSSFKPLKGNVYLAKVVRVEASLQAAFVDYGGNRHGFLPFNDIHPDYYRIPIADRKALLAEEEAHASQEGDPTDSGDVDGLDDSSRNDHDSGDHDSGDHEGAPDEDRPDPAPGDSVSGSAFGNRRRRPRYRIQEVIRRGQIMLVQIVKEERASKGAALTTRLSLAGRYCVLMPNTSRGGGVSRKISNLTDRRKVRQIVDDLDIPAGMAIIVRTAGQDRTKSEIRRDYDYLMRVWREIREKTLNSIAPCLINEEGDLVKRSVRDLYHRDMDEVLVNGEDAYRVARETMRMLIPSHARRVKHYKEDQPLFARYNVNQQLDSIFTPHVDLKSGGYIVIHQTEALVAIDVNSGRSTRERSIEETAFRTNLEAADEIAWQLRLRDLAGLIVVDFIDMDDRRHQIRVENHFKDALKTDRARIHVGRISMFGLLEMSRQRLRPSLAEVSTMVCPTCNGAGVIRSRDSLVLQVLRAIEDRAASGVATITVCLPTSLAFDILNQKRETLAGFERRYGVAISVTGEDALTIPNFRIEGQGRGHRPEHDGASKDDGVNKDGRDVVPSPVPETSLSGTATEDGTSQDQSSPDQSRQGQSHTSEDTKEAAPERRSRRRRTRPSGRGRRPRRSETVREPELTPGVATGDGEAPAPLAPQASSPDVSEDHEDAPARRRRTGTRRRSSVREEIIVSPSEQGPAAKADTGTEEQGVEHDTPPPAPGKKRQGWWQTLLP